MRHWGGAVKWLAILAVVVLLSFQMESCRNLFSGIGNPVESTKQIVKDVTGQIPVNDPKRPLKKASDENEIRALAAICLVDSAGEKPAGKEIACKEAMAAAIRYREKYGDSIDSIFRLAKTLYTRDRAVPTGWAERSVAFVFRPTLLAGYRKAQRVHALALAKQMLEGAVPPGCATHYIRASRETTEWYDEKTGAGKMQETMREVPRDPNVALRLFCPK